MVCLEVGRCMWLSTIRLTSQGPNPGSLHGATTRLSDRRGQTYGTPRTQPEPQAPNPNPRCRESEFARLWHLVDGQRADVLQVARQGLVLRGIVDARPQASFQGVESCRMVWDGMGCVEVRPAPQLVKNSRLSTVRALGFHVGSMCTMVCVHVVEDLNNYKGVCTCMYDTHTHTHVYTCFFRVKKLNCECAHAFGHVGVCVHPLHPCRISGDRDTDRPMDQQKSRCRAH